MIEAQPVKRLTLHPLRHRLIGVSQSQCQVLEFWPLTERKIGVFEIGTPSTDSVISAPTARRCIDSVLDLQGITKLEELSPRTRRWLQGLPVPQIVTYWFCVSKCYPTEDEKFNDMRRTCSSDIVKVCHCPHAKFVLESVNLGLRPIREDLIEVCNHRLNVDRAVLWHELVNWLVVPPVVAGSIWKTTPLY